MRQFGRHELRFERRDYKADPIEGPESRNVDLLIGVATIVGLLTAALIWMLERL